jgi:hypothetical protein
MAMVALFFFALVGGALAVFGGLAMRFGVDSREAFVDARQLRRDSRPSGILAH